jgi:HEAT repeat protein
LIEFLTTLKRVDAQDKWFSKKEVGNLLLAIECFEEVKNRSLITPSSEILLTSIKQKVEDASIRSGDLQDIRTVATAFGLTWQGNNALLGWLKNCLEGVYTQEVHTHYFAACALVEGWKKEEGTLSILINCVQQGYTKQSARTAALALVTDWQEDPNVLPFLKEIAQGNSNQRSRGAALLALARGYKEDVDALLMLKDICQDESYYLRGIALEALGENWCDDPDVLHILKTAAHTDQDWRVRGIAVEILIQQNENVPDLLDILYRISKEDLYEREADFEDNPRLIATQGLVRYYPACLKTLELLHDRAANDPDEQLRQWAEEQLKIQNVKLKTSQKC